MAYAHGRSGREYADRRNQAVGLVPPGTISKQPTTVYLTESRSEPEPVSYWCQSPRTRATTITTPNIPKPHTSSPASNLIRGRSGLGYRSQTRTPNLRAFSNGDGGLLPRRRASPTVIRAYRLRFTTPTRACRNVLRNGMPRPGPDEGRSLSDANSALPSGSAATRRAC